MMKIFYGKEECEAGKHKIYYAVPDPDIDLFYFTHSTNIELVEMTVDEVDPENKDFCMDLRKTINKTDVENDGKYHIRIEDGVPLIYEKENWEKYVPEEDL